MSNVSRRLRRQCRRSRKVKVKATSGRYSMTICGDPDPNCPVCRELMRQPGARWEERDGVRTILVPLSSDDEGRVLI